jgi:hypothetical protein
MQHYYKMTGRSIPFTNVRGMSNRLHQVRGGGGNSCTHLPCLHGAGTGLASLVSRMPQPTPPHRSP